MKRARFIGMERVSGAPPPEFTVLQKTLWVLQNWPKVTKVGLGTHLNPETLKKLVPKMDLTSL